jgi:starch synthase
MKVAMVASEVAPFCKTGGLGDVLGALPKALAMRGMDVSVFCPLYSQVRENADEYQLELRTLDVALDVPMGGELRRAGLRQGALPESGVEVWFVENDEYYGRAGLYVDPSSGRDYEDNGARFTFFCRAVLEACRALEFDPDIFHCHDWQSGLVPFYLRHVYPLDARTVFTIHNVAYQGVFSADVMRVAGLPWELFSPDYLEYYGSVSFLKGGLVGADVLTTVSKQYAREIQTTDFGMGMEGVLQQRSEVLHGIVNGVDYNVWNPETDKFLPARYDCDDLAGKRRCKGALQCEFSLQEKADVPLIGMIGRIVHQKGFDLMMDAFPQLTDLEFQLVVLGSGEKRYEELLDRMASRYESRVGVYLGFSERLAHLVEAGCDMFLMPSRFEPCGLNQLYSMRYGTVPLVSRTGGLVDTVRPFSEGADDATGFMFEPDSVAALRDGLREAIVLCCEQRSTWDEMILRCMQEDWSWERSAREYEEVYRKAISMERG